MDIGRKIDLLKYEQRLRSDSAAARFLGVSPQALHKVRMGAKMSDSMAVKLAEGIGEDAGHFLLELKAHQATDKRVKKAWQSLLAVSLITLQAFVFTATFSTPGTAQAFDGSRYYAQWRKRRRVGFRPAWSL